MPTLRVGPRCGGSKPTRLTSLRGQTHSAVDSTVIGDPRDSARSILARPCPGCGGYLRPTYGQGCHAVRLQSSSEPCEFRPIGSQLRKSCRRSRVGALSAHQRQEALQRLATGETQADIARSYNVDRPRSADCNKFVEELLRFAHLLHKMDYCATEILAIDALKRPNEGEAIGCSQKFGPF
jgi:hypothetical protein